MEPNLDPSKIIETIDRLEKRMKERFPDSGLCQVCTDLHTIAKESQSRCLWIQKPQIMLRVGMGAIITLIVVTLLVGMGATINLSSFQEVGFVDLLGLLEAGMNTVILVGAALFFFMTVEIRRKRNRAMAALHKLRVLAHVIDMHQLVKDPERVFSHKQWTTSSPRPEMNAFQLTRYLDYCTEMLSLVGKMGALYAQHFDDTVVLNAVKDIETLTTGLSQKIWQKIVILYRFKRRPRKTRHPHKRRRSKKYSGKRKSNDSDFSPNESPKSEL
ncbi:hypothetical protein [Candidatus Parabeggiatoa sp. HSG14]|uniref:hypothetical protein n=1 Tax=Candidatus Parabeggiatoa sp. HSG14 TaxID=3055593 RepID=UPI0025A7AC78|nr:hypothetical protein [Thiotrichales bacterium HSG14]